MGIMVLKSLMEFDEGHDRIFNSSFNAECVLISKEQMEENLTRSMVV